MPTTITYNSLGTAGAACMVDRTLGERIYKDAKGNSYFAQPV